MLVLSIERRERERGEVVCVFIWLSLYLICIGEKHISLYYCLTR